MQEVLFCPTQTLLKSQPDLLPLPKFKSLLDSNMAEQVGEASNPQKSTFCQELKVEKAFKLEKPVSIKVEQIDQIVKLYSLTT